MMALEWPKHETSARVSGAVGGVFDRRCFMDPCHEF